MSEVPTTYATLTLALHRQGPVVWAEVSLADPGNQAVLAPQRGPVALDLPALLAVQHDPAAYGRTLAGQVFDDAGVREAFLNAEVATTASGRLPRLSLRIDPSAQELHGLRWELLRHPKTDVALGTSERAPFSRFMVSRDWRPVRLRERSQLRAVVAVSAPPAEALARAGLAPVDVVAELARAREALGTLPAAMIGGPGSPCTLEAVVAAARDGADVLYIVSHGTFSRSTGMPSLYLQAADGGLAVVKGEDLASGLGGLPVGPRLVVLLSCQSAGDGGGVEPDERGSVQSTLAARLADAGIPAVLAMQGNIAMATAAALMPVFFRELLRDGQIDRALAVARGVVCDRVDHWMPVLFLRLSAGRLWYTADFASGRGAETWARLLPSVRAGRLVPILGPGMLESLGGSSFDVARQLAEDARFPLAPYEWDDLPRVTQFLSVRESRFNVVEAYKAQLTEDIIRAHGAILPPELREDPALPPVLTAVARHLRQSDPSDPFRVLATLPVSVYVTTNFEPILGAALTEANKRPSRLQTRWRHRSLPAPKEPVPDVIGPETPVVFHAFGALGKDGETSLVLTEDDYFDYLMLSASTPELMPSVVASALVSNSLIFLGFRLTDWSFRVLFRLIMNLEGGALLRNFCHVAVQVDPDLHDMADVEGAKAYLARYFDAAANIDIYWGTPREFLAQLHERYTASGRARAAADEWGG